MRSFKGIVIASLIVGAGGMTLASPAFGGDQLPPRYKVQLIDEGGDGSTEGASLNDLGQSTGMSNTNPAVNDYEAFVGAANGTVEYIAAPTGFNYCGGTVINNAGQVAGDATHYEQSGASMRTLFRYTPGVGVENLGTLGGAYGRVVDMNESGEVVGQWRTPDSRHHSFVYTEAGGLQDIGVFEGDYTTVMDISEDGTVVGSSMDANFRQRAFVWQNGQMQDLGTLGGNAAVAYYTNSSGVIVGTSDMADGTSRAFRYTPGVGMEPLPTMPGVAAGTGECVASWITDSGMVVGWWETPTERRAFYYTDADGMVDLGTDIGSVSWTGPVGATDSGEILLITLDENTYNTSALIYTPETGAHDLLDLTLTPLDWVSVQPQDINAAGQILLTGFSVNSFNTALLTPVTPGDLNADGHVDLTDLGMLLSGYGLGSGATYEQGDVDGDGDVDLTDLGWLLGRYGE